MSKWGSLFGDKISTSYHDTSVTQTYVLGSDTTCRTIICATPLKLIGNKKDILESLWHSVSRPMALFLEQL